MLDNDFDFENDPLTAELDDDVKHGELTFNPDGTFSYQHDGTGKKDDKFKYIVFDGTDESDEATVSIEIVETVNAPPFTVGSPPDQVAVEGVFFQLALAEYFGDLDEGDTLNYAASGLPGSGSLSIDSNSGILSGTPGNADARDDFYSVTAVATDSGGLSASLVFQLNIYPNARADLAVTASLSVNPVTVGESAQWNILVENRGPSDLGTGDLVAQWSTSGAMLTLTAPENCTISANDSTDPSVQCPLDGLGAGSNQAISVQGIQDSDGDNSLIANAVSDDSNAANNASLIGAQVVARFSEGPTQILSVIGSDVASGDLNGDGYSDLAVTDRQTSIFFNGGNRTVITPSSSLGADSGGVAVVVVDWNSDSYPDVAVAGLAGLAARVYLNDGAGNFLQSIDLQYANSGSILAAAGGDFDRDGFDDLVVTGTGGSLLLQSAGQAGFTLIELPAGPGIDVSTADLNNDGFADILVVESAGRSVRLLRNSGDGASFTPQELQRGSVAAVTAADLNGNGRADLLLAIDGEDLTTPQSKILYQRSDGTFPAGDAIGASPLRKMLAGDVNGDLLPDIIALNDAGVHQLYRGNPGGGFVLDAEQIVSVGMHRGVLLDFNNDQSLDLVMAGQNSSVVEIHANNGIGSLGRGDRDAPVIQLIGESVVTLVAGTGYEDPGATATDVIDGDLTGSIVTSGSFNTQAVGTYTVNYSVSDRAGNLGTAKRTINVEVNEGVGGSGGGAISLLYLLLQALMLISISARRATTARSLRS